MSREHYTDYDGPATARCERALLTLLGDLGPWRERIYLAGGLAPRYLVGQLPEGARAHVGTTDVDLVIGLALGDETPETYRTLQNNLEQAHFEQKEPSFRWARDVEGVTVFVEFLCETDEVEPGRIYRPKGEYAGSRFGAFNVRGAHLGAGKKQLSFPHPIFTPSSTAPPSRIPQSSRATPPDSLRRRSRIRRKSGRDL